MNTKIARALLALALAAGIMIVGTGTAHADATATSVALSAGDDCSQADLDLGLQTTTVDREYGQFSTLAGGVLDSFEQNSGLDDENGTFFGYGISGPVQADGTAIGTYAYIGDTPPNPATTAEWFVLYQCDTTGAANNVIYSCFGSYGSCPQTAEEAYSLLLAPVASPDPAAPGEVLTVTVEECIFTSGTGRLVDPGTGDPIAEAAATPAGQGNFSALLPIPADQPAGTLAVEFTCGGVDDPAYTSARVEVSVQVPTPTPTEPTTTTTAPATTTTATTTTTAPLAVVAQPRFTG